MLGFNDIYMYVTTDIAYNLYLMNPRPVTRSFSCAMFCLILKNLLEKERVTGHPKIHYQNLFLIFSVLCQKVSCFHRLSIQSDYKNFKLSSDK